MNSNTENNAINPTFGKPVLGNVAFTKELFIETVNTLEKQYRHDEKCSAAFKVILPQDYVSGYANHYLTNHLIKILQIAMNDTHKDSWVEYFICELDFGKNWKENSVTVNDKDFPLKTADDLWEILHTA